MSTVWVIIFRVIWVGLVLLSSVMTLFMFAFADSPDAGKAAQKMIGPIFVIALVLFGASVMLLMRGTWWSIPVSYAMVISPPFLVFLGYNLLMK